MPVLFLLLLLLCAVSLTLDKAGAWLSCSVRISARLAPASS
jgi:hypothetical protein